MGIGSNPVGYLKDDAGVLMENPLDWPSAPPQRLVVDPRIASEVFGEISIHLTMEAGTWVLPDGSLPAGPINLSLLEVPNKPAMLLQNKSTTSKDVLYESLGMFYVHANYFGVPLQTVKPIKVTWPLPGGVQNPQGVKLFRAGPATTRGFANQGFSTDWLLLPHQRITQSKLAQQRWLTTAIPSLGWYNFQAPLIRSLGKTMVSARAVQPSDLQIEHQVAYLLLHDCNALVRMYPTGQKFSCFNLPLHEPANVVMLARRGEELWGGSHFVGALGNSTLGVVLSPIDPQRLVQSIRALIAAK